MSNKVFEEAPQTSQPSGGQVDKVRKAARQLAYDTRYKVKSKFKDGQKVDPASLKRAYMQQLGSSSAPGPVKALAKKMLIGEEYDFVGVESSLSYIYTKVFVEGGGKREEEVESVEESADTKYVIRVKDKKTGREYLRKADRAKISELRSNPNIASVEITGRKEADTYDKTGKKEKKADKDYDGDGKVESGTAEYMGSRDKAIKKAMAKEEVIYEKDEEGEKKIDVMKGKNNVKINPSLGESIRAELDLIKAKRIAEQDAYMKQQEDEKRKEAAADQQAKKDKMMKLRILQNKMKAVRGGTEINASHEMEGDTVAEGEKEKKDDEDPRSMGTKVRLAKNKLRAMGLKMSYDMEGELVDEGMSPKERGESERARSNSTLEMGRRTKSAYNAARGAMIAAKQLKRDAAELKNESAEDRLRDRRMERGGVAGNVDYRRPAKNVATGSKKKYDGMSALDYVKADIRGKYGKSAIMDTKKK